MTEEVRFINLPREKAFDILKIFFLNVENRKKFLNHLKDSLLSIEDRKKQRIKILEFREPKYIHIKIGSLFGETGNSRGNIFVKIIEKNRKKTYITFNFDFKIQHCIYFSLGLGIPLIVGVLIGTSGPNYPFMDTSIDWRIILIFSMLGLIGGFISLIVSMWNASNTKLKFLNNIDQNIEEISKKVYKKMKGISYGSV